MTETSRPRAASSAAATNRRAVVAAAGNHQDRPLLDEVDAASATA